MIASAPAIEPATRTLPVRMKLSTKVSILPVTLQLTALTIERKWESRTRMNIGSSASGVGIKSPKPRGNELCQKGEGSAWHRRKHVAAGCRRPRRPGDRESRYGEGVLDRPAHTLVGSMLSEDAVAVLMLQDLATTTELCSSASMQIGFADLLDVASRSISIRFCHGTRVSLQSRHSRGAVSGQPMKLWRQGRSHEFTEIERFASFRDVRK